MKLCAISYRKWGGSMYRLYFIAKNNMKKKKSDVAVLIGLIALAVLILYISLSVLSRMGDVVDTAYEACNSADWYMVNDAESVKGLEKIFEDRSEVESFEMTPALLAGGVEYRLSEDEAGREFTFLLGAVDEERDICRINPEFSETLADNEILLPYYYKTAFGCKTGDDFFLVLEEHTYEFQIAGFTEDPLYANPNNITVYKCYITQAKMEEFKQEENAFLSYMECKAKLKDGVDADNFYMDISKQINEKMPQGKGALNYSFSWEAMRGGDVMIASIGMGIMLVFAVILMVIALIIVRFSIGNFCRMNLKNIGILRASGYTSGQLTGSFVMEMLMLSILGSILGLGLGAALGKFVGNILASIMGLSWHLEFSVKSAAFAMAASVLIIMLVAWLSSRKYGKMPVLDALREGVVTHSFHKNYFPLEKTRQPLLLGLGMKSIFRAKMKNLGILLIVAVLSFSACIGFGLYQNFVLDNAYLLKLVGAETGNAIIMGEDMEEMGKEIEELPEVEKVCYYSTADVLISHKDKEQTVTCDFWKEPEVLENEMLIQGRLPEYDNEIVLTTVICHELGIELGDVVYVKGSGEEKDYILVGIDQKINNSGKKGMLTLEGQKRLNGTTVVNGLYIYGKEGVSSNELINKLKETYPDQEMADSEKMVMDSLESIVVAMEVICVIFVVITVFVVGMVVFLLIKSTVVSERKNYGIYKALGFTTKQLCIQAVFSNLPVMFTGALAGALLSNFLVQPMVTVCLSSVGIQKCDMSIALLWLVLTVVGITVAAFLVALFTSAGIRKIEPVKMLTED